MSFHRIYILPTRSWAVLCAVLAAMWYAALSQNNSVAYLLMFFLASVVMVSAVHAHFALAGLRLRVGRVEPVFAGETARVAVEIINPTRRARLALEVAPNGQVFQELAHTTVGPIEAENSRSVELAVAARRRGRLALGRLAITTIYPMGFFRAWRYEPAETDALVYPAPAGSLPLPNGVAFTAEAVAGSGVGGDDYTGVRPYQEGESQRHVDWRAAARGQPLLVKQFAGSGSRRLWFDYGDVAGISDLEARLAQMSRWIVEAEGQGYAYGLRLPGFEAEPARGQNHQRRCLGALALFEEANPPKPAARGPFWRRGAR